MHTWYRPAAAAMTSGSGMLTSFRKAEWAPAACTCNTYATICAFRRNAFCPMPLPPPPRPFEGPLQYFFIYLFFISPLFFFLFVSLPSWVTPCLADLVPCETRAPVFQKKLHVFVDRWCDRIGAPRQVINLPCPPRSTPPARSK